MRVVKAVFLLLGVWLLCISSSISVPHGRWCGHVLAQGVDSAWYGPPVLTTDQLIAGFDEPGYHWSKDCRLVAAISLHFGDYEKVFTEAFPILQSYRTPATAWIVTGRIGQPGYMTLDQIKELAKHTWEIGSHGVTHRPLIDLNPSEIRAELENSKIILERQGFSVSGFLSPFGLYDDLVLSEIQRAYKYHRSHVFSVINSLPLADHGPHSRWELAYFQVKQDTPPLDVIIEIDRVNRRGGWLILDFHDMGDDDPSISYPPEALEKIIRFMRAELKLCTLGELQRGTCQPRR